MDAIRKAEIETLLAHITPGEWRAQGSLNDATVSVDGYILISCDVRNETDEALIETHQNARFIAACAGEKGIVRELLAEVERLERELETERSFRNTARGWRPEDDTR